MGQSQAAPRRVHDERLGRVASLAERVRVRADAVEVALHRLVDALRQREIGQGVVDVEQRVDLRVDRGASSALAGRTARPRGGSPGRTGTPPGRP